MEHFQNLLVWKYCVVFGTFFNDIVIQRGDDATPDIQKFKVPIEFAPKEKFLAMTNVKPTDAKKRAMQLPRMSYEFTGMSFDPTRKLERRNIINDRHRIMLRGAPWNINFRLNIITKNLLDATKIVEQALFMFQPDFTVDVKLIKDYDHTDRITTDYISVAHQDEFEGDFEKTRRTIWEIDFVMKAWLYGPVDDGKQIKRINLDYHPTLNRDSAYEQTIIIPGLTDQGDPTTDVDESVPYLDIEQDDNYGIIVHDEPLKDGPIDYDAVPTWPPARYSFTLTAGGIPATTWGGFERDSFGSISNEPIDGLTLTFLAADQTGGSMSFQGDQMATVENLVLYVNGVGYPDLEWSFQWGSTYLLFSEITGPQFTPGQDYLVELK